MDEFKEAISLDPSHISSTLELGHYFGGVKLFDKAIAKFKRVIDMQPDHPAANLELGKLYLANEDYSSANAQFKKLPTSDPRVANSFIILDLPKTSQPESALDYFKKAIEMDSIYPIHYYCAKIYQTKGQWKQLN